MSSCLTDDVPMPVWLRGVVAVVALGGVAYGLGLLSFLEDDAKAGGSSAVAARWGHPRRGFRRGTGTL